MSVGLSLYLVFHIIASIALVIGYLHEDKVVKFEDAVFRAIKRKIRAKKAKKRQKSVPKQAAVKHTNVQNKSTYIYATSLDKYDCFHAA